MHGDDDPSSASILKTTVMTPYAMSLPMPMPPMPPSVDWRQGMPQTEPTGAPSTATQSRPQPAAAAAAAAARDDDDDDDDVTADAAHADTQVTQHRIDACCVATSALLIVNRSTRKVVSATRDAATMLLAPTTTTPETPAPSPATPATATSTTTATAARPPLSRTNSDIFRQRMNTTETIIDHAPLCDDEPRLVGRCVDEFVDFAESTHSNKRPARECADRGLILVRIRKNEPSRQRKSGKRRRRRRRWAYVCAHCIGDLELWFLEEITGVRAVLRSGAVPSRGRWVGGKWRVTKTIDDIVARHDDIVDDDDNDDDEDDEYYYNDFEEGFERSSDEDIDEEGKDDSRAAKTAATPQRALQTKRSRGLIASATSLISSTITHTRTILKAADAIVAETEKRTTSVASFVGAKALVPTWLFTRVRSVLSTTPDSIDDKSSARFGAPPPNTIAIKINSFGRVTQVYPLCTFLGRRTELIMNRFIMRLVATEDVAQLCRGLSQAVMGHGRCNFIVSWDWNGAGSTPPRPSQPPHVDDPVEVAASEVDSVVSDHTNRGRTVGGAFADLISCSTRSPSPITSDSTHSRSPSPPPPLSPARSRNHGILARVRFTVAALPEGTLLAVIAAVDATVPPISDSSLFEPPENESVAARGEDIPVVDVDLTHEVGGVAGAGCGGQVQHYDHGWRSLVAGVVADVYIAFMKILGLRDGGGGGGAGIAGVDHPVVGFQGAGMGAGW